MIYHREYTSFEEYSHIQGFKALKHKMYVIGGNHSRTKSFIRQFKRYKKYLLPGKVLCLGARTGCETKGFIKNGFDVIGIDLHPLSELVMKADWHNIPFAPNTFENVFTNSLDHCLDFDKLVSEIKRVLKPKGVFVFETSTKYAFDSRIPGDEVEDVDILLADRNRHRNNSMFWDAIWDIPEVFIREGFYLFHSDIGESSSAIFLKRE